ncbi:hypothetical protein GOPIP_068_00040 [Gordonia polyisoprenivorans NBRC 16320 = JCM 10675]|nr:hypothetical protein GOPIP_068_00040 [Gordonia polyisoprenivorans NBRC 16320 = JCM 10675]
MSAQPEPMTVTVQVVTDPRFADEVAAVAAATFPLACPPHSAPANIDAFIRDNLAPADFAEYIDAPESDVLLARTDDDIPVGYALVHHREPTDADVAAVITDRPSSEVSKIYVLPDHHARGRTQSPSRLLMETAIERARARGAASIWLGVNQENARAQRFYAKMGFTRAGVKTFDLNGSVEHDYVLSRPVLSRPLDV